MKNKGRYGYLIGWIFTFIDFVVMNATFVVVAFLSHAGDFITPLSLLALNAAMLVTTIATRGIHTRRTVYLDQALLEMLKELLLHGVLTIAMLALLAVPIEWKVLARFYPVLVFTLGLWWIVSRKVIKSYRRHGYNYRRTIVVGGGPVAERLIDELEGDRGYGYKIVGLFDDADSTGVRALTGTIADIDAFVLKNVVDEMYCTIPDSESATVKHLIALAEAHDIEFYLVPQIEREVTRRFDLDKVGTVPILAIHSYPLHNPLNRFAKRLFDLVVSSVLLVLFPLIWLPIAIGIKLSSPGPVFFKQRRTGYRGRSFTCYKFRTMRLNDERDTRQATPDDERTTRFGNFLRRTSIDELPQLFNVWLGEMSLVGPRPHMLAHTEIYSKLIDKYMLRHSIKPGITGWAQVNGYRGVTDQLWKMERRVEFDVWYTENWTFMLDLKILYLTVFKVLFGDEKAV